METQIGIDDVLRNLSERGQLEWELAVKRAENAVLQEQLALLNGDDVGEIVDGD
jgi:hypothetical protein